MLIHSHRLNAYSSPTGLIFPMEPPEGVAMVGQPLTSSVSLFHSRPSFSISIWSININVLNPIVVNMFSFSSIYFLCKISHLYYICVKLKISSRAAQLLGFKSYIPPYRSTEDKDLLLGYNYASTSAGIRAKSTGQFVVPYFTFKHTSTSFYTNTYTY